MKCRFVLVGFVLMLALMWLLLPAAQAQQDPDDQYLVIYGLLQQGETFDRTGEPQRALQDYTEALNRLQHFHRVFPDWYPKIVNFRLSYLADKIAVDRAKLPSTNAPPAAASAPATPAAAAAAVKARLEAQLKALRNQVKQLQTDNQTLQDKLKEALAVQPASVSPAEYAQAEGRLRALQKENELLKVTLAQASGGAGEAGGTVNTQAVVRLKQQLAETQRKLAAQTKQSDQLTVENQSLQTRLKTLMASASTAEALRQENALLKQELAGRKSAPAGAAEIGEVSAELARARTQITNLQSQAAINSLQRMALESRIKQLRRPTVKPSPAAGPGQAENAARIRELERERDELRTQLGEADRQLRAHTNLVTAAQLDALAQQVDTLRARIAVDEAKPIPYTPQELALFKRSTPALVANTHPEAASIQELPGGTASLAAEAQGYYSAKQYGKAAADYQKILRQDTNNGVALANLAAIELEEKKFKNADQHIQAALAQSPNDAYNLTVLGRLRFAEGKYDAALNALSRAAKLDPKNPDIENYLGVTLAQKGLRTQAETALRRAVELDPHYAAAHNNLAVIYLTQKPPMVELARWHYEQALANGQPRNPALEKLLAKDGAPVSPSQ